MRTTMIICSKILLLLLVAAAVSVSATPPPSSVYSELLDESDVKGDYNKPLPISYIDPGDLPAAFSWGNHQNRSFLTRMLNQHIPQYCGSCWAHAAISVFQDRIKIARHAQGEDIGLSIQYLLNCGRSTGSCHGGTILKTFKFIREESGFIPYETCQPYLACSHDSEEGFCPHVDTTCTKLNTCRTCDTFVEDGGTCREIDIMPNATVAEYGVYNRNDYKSQDLFVQAVKAEILARGPVGVALNGHGLANYTGGVYDDTSQPTHHTHAVSITGWGTNQETGQEYWIVRNSWGEYWGEMGSFRIEMGKNILGIEESCTWVTPATFTTVNYPCDTNGANCAGPTTTQTYVDPSDDIVSIQQRLQSYKGKTSVA